MRRPPASTTLILPAGTSSVLATSSSVATRACGLPLALEVRCEFRLERPRDALVADPIEHVLEEALDDEARGGLVIEPAAAQIEQLLGVDRADGGAVRAAHVIRLDLELGLGIGARTLGEQQISVGLVGVAALRALLDDDHAGVDRVRVSVERALEEQITVRVAGAVALQRVVVELLRAAREDQTEHVALGARAEQFDLDVALGESAAGAQIERHELRAVRDARVLMREHDRLRAALLHVRVGAGDD